MKRRKVKGEKRQAGRERDRLEIEKEKVLIRRDRIEYRETCLRWKRNTSLRWTRRQA